VNTRAHYDVAIIGAGLSGIAAGIRVAHFGRRVCIFERHNAPGGLNGFYSIAGRKFDVGLHAVTNYPRAGAGPGPLVRLLRQLRIHRDEFGLCEQRQSRIAFGPRGEESLRFTNDFAVFEEEVARRFPAEIDGLRRLAQLVRDTTYSVDSPVVSARSVVRRHIGDPLLEEMLMCPLLMYGSARENDMDFGQFALLFEAVLLEGFARPLEGVRRIMRVLLERYRAAGGERRMKCGVRRIVAAEGRVAALVLDSGEEVTAGHVISSAGWPETMALIGPSDASGSPAPGSPDLPAEGLAKAGRITFVETVSVLDRQPAELGWGDDTIVFFNDSGRLAYERPEGQVDPRSGVICIPNNFDYGPGRFLPEGLVRVTCLANYEGWARLPEETYRADKARWFEVVQRSARRFLPSADEAALAAATVATDMFTPRTVEKFTGHFGGAIYGSAEKNPGGTTALANLYLCGSDQGMLGIVGAMLSGIAMANRHVLRKG
jgi:phytoene dehydrogenase-like protein